MRYAFEYFVRNEFETSVLGYNIANTQLGFNLSIGKIIAIFFGYFVGLTGLAIIILIYSDKRISN